MTVAEQQELVDELQVFYVAKSELTMHFGPAFDRTTTEAAKGIAHRLAALRPQPQAGSVEQVERVARSLYFDHVDQHGYPNGLMTWDELPEHIERRVSIDTRKHWRSLAEAAIQSLQPDIQSLLAGERRKGLEEAAALANQIAAEEDRNDHRRGGGAYSVAQAIRSLGEVGG